MIILALDALDLKQVERFNCHHLMQHEYGETDLTSFKQERTVVLWAAFLTGKNLEAEIPVKTQWTYRVHPKQTFLPYFPIYMTIDVPALSYNQEAHAEERRLLKGVFDETATIEAYDAVVWRNHEENTEVFFKAVGRFDLVMGYFNLADAIGHLSFGINDKLAAVYADLDCIAEAVKDLDDALLIISDHGMKAIGRYGDHTRNGFYSFNRDVGLRRPKITSFNAFLRRLAEDEYAAN